MKNNSIDNYEGALYPSQESFQKVFAKNASIKGSAAVLAVSVTAFALTACEPPKLLVRDDDTNYQTSETSDPEYRPDHTRRETRASTEYSDPTDSSDPTRETTETRSTTDSTSETTVIRRFPDKTTQTDSTDYTNPYNDDFLTAGIIMYPGDYDDNYTLAGEIMIEDIDLE